MIPLVIFIFVDAQDAGSPLPDAFARAAERALGERAVVSIHPLDADVTDAAMAERAREAGAAVVARIVWTDDARLAARLQVFEIANGRAIVRHVVFEPSDLPSERGRTLGLLLASAVNPETAGGGERTPPEQPRVETAPAEAGQDQTLPMSERWAVDAAAEAGVALGSSGSGMGGAAGVRWARWPRVALRLGARARFGQLAAAQATSSAYALGAGVAVALIPAGAARRLGVVARAEAMLLFESLTHLSADDPSPVRQGRFLPGAAALLEAEWSLSSAVALRLAVGPEVAFGRTRVFVGPTQVADLAPVRLIVQGGLLARF